MADERTINSPNREDHQENRSPAASDGGRPEANNTLLAPQGAALSDFLRVLTERLARDDASANTAFNQHSDRQNPNESDDHQTYSELTRAREKEAEFIEIIKALKSQMHRATSSAPDIDRALEQAQQTPFTNRVSNADMRQVAKLKMPSYDGTTEGTTDPMNHLTAFTIATGRVRLPKEEKDAVLCQLFVEKLSGAALLWFSKLKPRSIDSFNDLTQAFMKHYSMFVERGASSADLWNLTQKEGESLRSFIERFKKIASKVTIDDEVAVEALRRGLWWEGRYRETLSSNKPLTLEDALHRATTYANIEEEQESLKKQHKSRASSSSRDVKPKETHHEPRQHSDSYRDDGGRKRDATYVVNVEQDSGSRNTRPREVAQEETQRSDRSEPYTNRPGGGDRPLYCTFHKSKSHDTSECKTLQGILLKKYQQGEIQNIATPVYQQRPQQSQQGANRAGNASSSSQEGARPPPPDNQSNQQAPTRSAGPISARLGNPQQNKAVFVILGGQSSGKDSVRSMKEHKRKAEAAAKWEQPGYVNLVRNDLPIVFSDADTQGLDLPHNDPLVVTLPIGNCDVAKVLIDTGSSVDLIYRETLRKMDISDQDIKSHAQRLTGFDSKQVAVVGTIKLPVFAGDELRMVKFVVIDEPAIYNVIMGTPWIHSMKAVASSYHQCLRFPNGGQTFTIRGNQSHYRTCVIAEKKIRTASLPVNSIKAVPEKQPSAGNIQSRPIRQGKVVEGAIVEMLALDPARPQCVVSIGSQLDDDFKAKLGCFLKENIATFAWTMEDMTGIHPSIVTHELGVDPTYKPIRQKRRKLGIERARAVNEEVEKLLKAKSICEVKYPEWLANPVVVKKKSGKWRICIDFTDLNKACPKDCYPLPSIDRLIEATAGNELLSFMDAFSGYNQIRMHPDDREKTAFITDRGTFCYKVMPFGLKNAGATYQRLVNHMFANQLGISMEVYIDDMLVKSARAVDHIDHLRACFEVLNKYGMKLNPAKCTFGVTSGEFLGYIITQRGIEANPKQISALLELPSPRNKKEVQRLSGRIAALNRFIARSTDKCLPFYKLLRSNKSFEWSEQCEKAFQELKTYISTPPILATPEDGETLYLYIAISSSAVSGVLIKDDRGEQRPVFYVSKTLEGAEARYTASEKIAFAIVTAARKLRPYFQSHPIIVLSDVSIRTILHSPSQSGRLVKWAIELTEYDIAYQPRKTLKSQVLADFLIELPKEFVETTRDDQTWSLFVDGSSSQQGAGVGIRLSSPTGETLEQAFRLNFKPTNNEAEYEALLAGLRLAKAIGVEHIQAHCDSQLVASQFSGEYEAKDERMNKYLRLVQQLSKNFATFELIKISRAENKNADALAALAAAIDPIYCRTVPVSDIDQPSIATDGTVQVMLDEDHFEQVSSIAELDEDHLQQANNERDPGNTTIDWQDEIRVYIEEGIEPIAKWDARRLKAKASRYTVLHGRLHRWSSSGTLLTCISQDQTLRVITETHEGAGGNHSGGRALSLKIRKLGYFWPSMVSDCEKFAAQCEKCQRHAPLINAPTEQLTAGIMPYPFMRWAMDIIGPMPISRGKKYILVLTDYFTKWVEASAYSKIQESDVQTFLWKNIICRHGLPYEIVTDNGSNLASAKVKGFCAKWRIKLLTSTPRYPQGNGQAEATNKTILDSLKKRLGTKKGFWADELDGVLWSYRTTVRRSTNQSPFSLSHGVEALAPAEANVYTLRRTEMPQNTELNNEMLSDNLDAIEEMRDQALLRINNYQRSAALYYNKKARNRFFDEGDLVLRKVFENTKECSNKLGAKWEGPYIISKIVKPGVFELVSMDLQPIQHAWNSINLKRYYF